MMMAVPFMEVIFEIEVLLIWLGMEDTSGIEVPIVSLVMGIPPEVELLFVALPWANDGTAKAIATQTAKEIAKNFILDWSVTSL